MEYRSQQQGEDPRLFDDSIEKSMKEDGEERERDECVVTRFYKTSGYFSNVPGEFVERVRGMERRCLCNSFKSTLA